MTHLLGVDTGGTYTDAVVWCDDAERVLGSAKAPTTHDDLAHGIGQAIDGALGDAGVEATSIGLVSLSTTLATNALVEDKGRRACLILVGFDDDALERGGLREALADDELIVVPGGHTSHGDEAQPLDLDAVGRRIQAVAPSVDAFAVTAQFSVRNPAHEILISDLILDQTACAVTCSHELSASLNGPKRGVTALLNARLVALIDELLAAAGAMLRQRGVDAPVMIVRGDGGLVSTEFVRGRPIETILSGPAASILGAAALVGATDAVVSDIGGTTTDIAIVTDGMPRLGPDGAVVGGHHTMVEAVEMRTHGIGGDSEIGLADRAVGPQLTVGPQRVLPLARLALQHPELVHTTLQRQGAREPVGEFDGMFAWRSPRPPRGLASSRSDADLLERLVAQPSPVDGLVRSRVDVAALRRLVAKGLAHLAAVTPTDAAHVLGHQNDFDREAARLGCAVLARRKDRYGEPIAATADAMAQHVLDAVANRTAEALLEAAFAHDGIAATPATDPLVAAALGGSGRATRLDIGLAHPVIALGAGAGTHYPPVGRRLGTSVTVPELAPVANAIGAAVGRVVQQASILVSAPRRGVYRVHAGGEPETYFDLGEATARAKEAAAARAAGAAESAGAVDVEVTLTWDERSADIDGKAYFVEGTATARASGRPRVKG